MLTLKIAFALACLACTCPGFRVQTYFKYASSCQHLHFLKVAPSSLGKSDYHIARNRQSIPVLYIGKELHKDEPSAIPKVDKIAAAVDGLQRDFPEILVREPKFEHFAEDFQSIQETAGTVKGLARNKRLLNWLRDFHSRLAATPFKDKFTVRCERKHVAVGDVFEPALVADWTFELDADLNIPVLGVLKHFLPQRMKNDVFPLKVEGSSTFLFNADGKIKSMKIENGLLEWKYFAFGSNLNADVLARRTGGRSVTKIAPQPAILRDYALVFNLGPPSGPAAASVERSAGKACHGVLYTLDLQQFLAMLASEGVPNAYSVEPVMVEPYPLSGGGQSQQRTKAYTLVSGRGLVSYPPSTYYKDLLVKGAHANSLDVNWVKWLESLKVAWTPFARR
mmetsp:Transcript_55889/g.105284  ORF Transcript_55889/g.105284 Transcript_55889/m.105284 type:complete len:394 (+) Transcript_55889:73-1254(+)